MAHCAAEGQTVQSVTREELVAVLAKTYETTKEHLNEKQRRLLLGAHALQLGHGGVGAVCTSVGVHRKTVTRGLREVRKEQKLASKIRLPGGGRPKKTDTDPKLLADTKKLVDVQTRGDPMSLLRWCSKSTRKIAEALKTLGHKVSDRLVARILASLGFSLQACSKTFEGRGHDDRNAQFEHVDATIQTHILAGQPVVSVDTKKKELVGNFANSGRDYQPVGTPEQVNVYDFPNLAEGKAVPYGIYDVAKNTGYVNVGTDHDTAAFAVSSILLWWENVGQHDYPEATKLLIVADGGGSNGSRVKAFKVGLAGFAQQTSLEVSVCHLPPGTSKWNKIEHRMFSHITMNWRGRPLRSFEEVVELISSTTTTTGLKIVANLDIGEYPVGVRYTDADIEALHMTRHAFHGKWNYTLHPDLVD